MREEDHGIMCSPSSSEGASDPQGLTPLERELLEEREAMRFGTALLLAAAEDTAKGVGSWELIAADLSEALEAAPDAAALLETLTFIANLDPCVGDLGLAVTYFGQARRAAIDAINAHKRMTRAAIAKAVRP